MAEFITVFSSSAPAVSPLRHFLRANLDRKRQIWPALFCGLHYVGHQHSEAYGPEPKAL